MTNETILLGSLHRYNFKQADSVYSLTGVSPTIMAHGGGTLGHQVLIFEDELDCDLNAIELPNRRV